jgi:hypothetical protein
MKTCCVCGKNYDKDLDFCPNCDFVNNEIEDKINNEW